MENIKYEKPALNVRPVLLEQVIASSVPVDIIGPIQEEDWQKETIDTNEEGDIVW